MPEIQQMNYFRLIFELFFISSWMTLGLASGSFFFFFHSSHFTEIHGVETVKKYKKRLVAMDAWKKSQIEDKK